MSSGEKLISDQHQAEAMAYAARQGMEKVLRYKKLRRTSDTLVDGLTSGGFEGAPMTTAYLHNLIGRYFKRRIEKNLALADEDAKKAQTDK